MVRIFHSAFGDTQPCSKTRSSVLGVKTLSNDPQLATEFAIETIAKHPIQGHFAAVLVHQKTNAMVCSAPPCRRLQLLTVRPCVAQVADHNKLTAGCRSATHTDGSRRELCD